MDKNVVSQNMQMESKIEIARTLIREQNFNQAKKYLEELIKLYGKNPEINYLLGQLYEVDQEYQKAVSCFSNLLDFELTYDLKSKIAQCFVDGHEYEKAYNLFKDLFRENPDDVNVFEQFAHTARILEKTDEAVEAYNRILDVDRNNVIALTQLSEIYYDTEDKMNHYLIKAKLNYIENMLSSSVDCLKKALNYSEDDEDVVNILLNLGKVLTEAGKYQEAIEQYQFILNLEPENTTAKEKIDLLCKKLCPEEESQGTWVDILLNYFNSL